MLGVKKIDLELKTKYIKCKTISFKNAITFECREMLKYQKSIYGKRVEKLLIEELKKIK